MSKKRSVSRNARRFHWEGKLKEDGPKANLRELQEALEKLNIPHGSITYITITDEQLEALKKKTGTEFDQAIDDIVKAQLN